jgi:hypothetical protein
VPTPFFALVFDSRIDYLPIKSKSNSMVKNMPHWYLRCDQQIKRGHRPNIIIALTIGLKYLNCIREGKDSRKTPEVNSEGIVVE